MSSDGSVVIGSQWRTTVFPELQALKNTLQHVVDITEMRRTKNMNKEHTEEAWSARVQQLEAECLDVSTQVEYLQNALEQSNARVCGLELLVDEAGSSRHLEHSAQYTHVETQPQLEQLQKNTLATNTDVRMQILEAESLENAAKVEFLEAALEHGREHVLELEKEVNQLRDECAPILEQELIDRTSEADFLRQALQNSLERVDRLEAEIAQLNHVTLTESISKVRELEERNSHERACSDELRARLSFLQESTLDVHAALARSTKRIIELEEQAAADAACKTRLKATIALMEKTIEDSVQCSPTMPLTAKRHFSSPPSGSEQVYSGRRSDTVVRHVAPCGHIADPLQPEGPSVLCPAKVAPTIHTPVLTASRVLQEPRWSTTSTAVPTGPVHLATPVTSQQRCLPCFSGPSVPPAMQAFPSMHLQERVILPYSSLESVLPGQGYTNPFFGNLVNRHVHVPG